MQTILNEMYGMQEESEIRLKINNANSTLCRLTRD